MEQNEQERRSESLELSQNDSTSDLPSEAPSVEDLHPLVSSLGEDAGVLYLDATYSFSVNRIFDYLFTESTFYKDFLKSRNITDLVLGDWGDPENSAAIRARTLTYVIYIKSLLYKKKCKTVEKQSIHAISAPGRLFVIDTETVNEDAPFSGSYNVFTRYCIHQVNESSCQLRVSSRLRYIKSVNGLVKDIIERECASGLREHFSRLAEKLGSLSDEHSLAKMARARIQDGTDSPSPDFTFCNNLDPLLHSSDEYDDAKEQLDAPLPSMTEGAPQKHKQLDIHAGSHHPIYPRHSIPHNTTQKSYPLFSSLTLCHLLAVLLSLLLLEALLLSFTYTRVVRLQDTLDRLRSSHNSDFTATTNSWMMVIEAERRLHEEDMSRVEHVVEKTKDLMETVLGTLQRLESALKKQQLGMKTQQSSGVMGAG